MRLIDIFVMLRCNGSMSTSSDYITLDDLEAAGLTVQEVRERCPHATTYTALGGQPCWLREQLTVLLPGKSAEKDTR